MSEPAPASQTPIPRPHESASPAPSNSKPPPAPPPQASSLPGPSPETSTSLPLAVTKRPLPDVLTNNNNPAAQSAPSRPKRPRTNVKYSPVRTTKGPARRIANNVPNTGAARASTSMEISNPSGDFCSACGAAGLYVCCDGCPRVFHPFCLDPPLGGVEDAGEHWYCRECEAARGNLPQATSTTNAFFSRLIEKQNVENPRAFQLPEGLRNRYEDVATNPYTGEYVDQSRVKTKKKLESTKGYVEEPDPYRIKTKDGKTILCYTCGLGASSQKNLRIVGCDVCDQYFHLDCLDPPLVTPPPTSVKWVCPLHAEKAAPSRRMLKDSVLVPVRKTNIPNNGDIEVIPAPQKRTKAKKVEEISINRVRYQVPENIVILDFWAKLGKTKEMQLLTGRTRESSPLTPLSSTANSPRHPILGRDILPPSTPSSENSVPLCASPVDGATGVKLTNRDIPPLTKNISPSPSRASTPSQVGPLAPNRTQSQDCLRPDLSFLLEAAQQNLDANREPNNTGLSLLGEVASSAMSPSLATSKPPSSSKTEKNETSQQAGPATSASRTRTRGSARLANTLSSAVKPPEVPGRDKAETTKESSIKPKPRRRKTASKKAEPLSSAQLASQSNGNFPSQEHQEHSKKTPDNLASKNSSNEGNRKRPRQVSESNSPHKAPAAPHDSQTASNQLEVRDNKATNSDPKPGEKVPSTASPSPGQLPLTAENIGLSREPPGQAVQHTHSESGIGADTDPENQSNKQPTRIRIKGTKYLGPSVSPPTSQINKSSSPVANTPQPVQAASSKPAPSETGRPEISSLQFNAAKSSSPPTQSRQPDLNSPLKAGPQEFRPSEAFSAKSAPPASDKTSRKSSAPKPRNRKRPSNPKDSNPAEDESPQNLPSQVATPPQNGKASSSTEKSTIVQPSSLIKSTPQSNPCRKISSNRKTSSATVKDRTGAKQVNPSSKEVTPLSLGIDLGSSAPPKKRVRRSHPSTSEISKNAQSASQDSSKLEDTPGKSDLSPSHEPTKPPVASQSFTSETPVEPSSRSALSSNNGAPSRKALGKKQSNGLTPASAKTEGALEQAPQVLSSAAVPDPSDIATSNSLSVEIAKVRGTQDLHCEPSPVPDPKSIKAGPAPKNKQPGEKRPRKFSSLKKLPKTTSVDDKTTKGASETGTGLATKSSSRPKQPKQKSAPNPKSLAATADHKSAAGTTASNPAFSGGILDLPKGIVSENGSPHVDVGQATAHRLNPTADVTEKLKAAEQRVSSPLGSGKAHNDSEASSDSSQPRKLSLKKPKIKRKSNLGASSKMPCESGSGVSSHAAAPETEAVPSIIRTSSLAARPAPTSFVPHPQNPLTLIPHSQHSMTFVAHPQNPVGFVPHPQHGISLVNSSHQLPFVAHPQFPISLKRPGIQPGIQSDSAFGSSNNSLPSQSGRHGLSVQGSKSILPSALSINKPNLPSPTSAPPADYVQPSESSGNASVGATATPGEKSFGIPLPLAHTLQTTSSKSWN